MINMSNIKNQLHHSTLLKNFVCGWVGFFSPVVKKGTVGLKVEENHYTKIEKELVLNIM